MADPNKNKKARQRVSYVLELDHSSEVDGHRLGVNGLAVDPTNAILYSGGRDGVVAAWDLNIDLNRSSGGAPNPETKPKPTKFRASTQAHTHWVNDIALTSDKTALASASSDLTVKIWRPLAGETEAHTIGQHADYVKCVAAPRGASWVASGGLDRRICLWDINGGGKTLEIDVRGEEVAEKGSVYALSVGQSILASGGPECILRLWDPKSGQRITKFVGHTDNVRAILVNEAGDTVMTASSDQTVKIWSVTAGRCMDTLTMHNDSVWSLFSDHPNLKVFYSGDRTGYVAKTDVRGGTEIDDGLSVAIAQEHHGVSKIVACDDYIWTASASSSINRWGNVDTGPDAAIPEAFRNARPGSPSVRRKQSPQEVTASTKRTEIPAQSILRISNTATFPPLNSSTAEGNLTAAQTLNDGGSRIIEEAVVPAIGPIHHLPEETIEGQNGLVKHKLLNDRRRVLTLDTTGDVLLWDLIKCEVIQRFGKKHLEDVEPEVNTLEAVAPWCSIDTSSGNLTVVLEPFNCFDAEMYADELILDEPVEFREDQRINLGRWILRYLFAKLVDEEIKRDEAHRRKLNENVEKRRAAARALPPLSIRMPNAQSWEQDDLGTTPKANGFSPMTPGLAIGVATPGAVPRLPGVSENPVTPSSPLDRRGSAQNPQPSGESDYFSSAISSVETPSKPAAAVPAEKEQPKDETPKSPIDGKDKEKENGKGFKKFRMSFGTKKGRSASTTIEKPSIIREEKKDEENKSESSSNHEKEVDDSFQGVIQKIRNEYEKQLLEDPDQLVETKVTPSLPVETPVLKLPSGTKVIIQEETSGGSANLYRGTVETVGADADIIEEKGPMWLGELLLTNALPPKDPVKVSFVLHPWQETLPSISTSDGNNRLNANRMLRVKKIIAYVAERIDPLWGKEEDAMKPEDYLELYCNEMLLPVTMSLATLRAHIWKGGNDVVLHYKSNGRKELPKEIKKPSTPADKETPPDAPPASTSSN